MKRLQAADHALGRAACALLQPLRLARFLRRAPGPVQRELLVKFWGIGSLQLLTAAAAHLRRAHPDSRLELLTLSPNAEFARGLGLFDEVLTLDVRTPSWLAVLTRILRLVGELRARRYDSVYDFEFFTRFSAVIALLSGARETHGFASPSVWRGGFHTHTAPFNRYWHVARNFRNLAGGEDGLPVAAEDIAPFRVEPEHRAEAEAALVRAGLDPAAPLVVLNPNAGSLSLERRWPPARFGELARRLAVEDGVQVALIGAAGEREWTRDVRDWARPVPEGRVADLSGRLSMGGLHALLKRAEVFVGNDSGPMHLAAALGAPTVGLFGPETPVMYAPLGARTQALYEPPACSPCINVHDNKVASCVRGRPECLMNISVDAVLEAARALRARGRFELLPERPAAGADAR